MDLDTQIVAAREEFLKKAATLIIANCEKNGISFRELLLGLADIAPNDKAARLLEEAAAAKE